MAVADLTAPVGRMTPQSFRRFQDGRPDEERWELVDGRPVMMTPPSLDHNRIASNLERLLNDALEVSDPTKEAVQRVGVELGPEAWSEARGADRPEPDVAVIDYDPAPGRRFVDRAHLLAEIVSASDRVETREGRWIDVKARLYRAHPPCRAVLVVEQESLRLTLHRRDPAGAWAVETLEGPDAVLALPDLGFSTALRAIWAGTAAQPRRAGA